jgi:hypothetical protein
LSEVKGQGCEIVYVDEFGWRGVAMEEPFEQLTQVEPFMLRVVLQAVVEVKPIH